jgi:hypothetical protein
MIYLKYLLPFLLSSLNIPFALSFILPLLLS